MNQYTTEYCVVGSEDYAERFSSSPPDGFYFLYEIRIRKEKSYVGVTKKSVAHRLAVHRRRGSKCPRLRSALAGCVDSDIEVRILGVFLYELISLAEELAIRELSTLHPLGYNLTTGGFTYNLTEESIGRIAASRRGKPLSAEHRAAISVARAGKKFGKRSAAIVEKVRLSNTGKKRSPEVCAAMSLSRKGRKLSEGQKKKISEALTGKKKSEEHIASFKRAWEKRRAKAA